MSKLSFQSGSYRLNNNESVLDCLLRNGKPIPYACKAGMCQACLVKSVGAPPPEQASKWVKPTLRAKNYCLACQWVPDSDVEAALPTVEEFSVEVLIDELTPLNDRIMRVRLVPQHNSDMFASEPGQYLTLINPAGVARCYSIANSFEKDRFIELHIGRTSHGEFTSWLFNEAQCGDQLHIRGPAGDCFYTTPETEEEFPLILAGTGTGLAPLYGILNEALMRKHSGEISLYHGGRNIDSLYYTDQLHSLSRHHSHFNYVPVCPEAETTSITGCLKGQPEKVITEHIDPASLPKARIYLCGNPDFVHHMRKQLFLKGARSAAIFCDPFLERSVVQDPS